MMSFVLDKILDNHHTVEMSSVFIKILYYIEDYMMIRNNIKKEQKKI